MTVVAKMIHPKNRHVFHDCFSTSCYKSWWI